MSRHTHNWRFLGRWLFRTLALAAVCGAVALAPQLAMAASGTWIGGTDTNWGNSANWSGGTIAGTNLTLVTTTANITDTATFNTATNLTVIPDANRYVASITFDTLAGNFTIGQSSGNTLYMAPGTVQIARTIRGTGLTETVAAPLNLYSLTPSTSATFNFFNNSPDPTNSLVISGNISSNLTATTSIELSGTSGFADQGPQATNVLSGSIQDPGGYMRLLKYGLNTWTVNAAQTYAGDTYLMGGTMTLNFAAAGAPTTNILYNGLATPGRITMESANLYLQGAAGASNTQNIYKLGFGPGSQITVAPGAGGTMTLNCTANSANGSWQRNPDGNNPGGSLNITIGNGGAVYAGTGGGNQAGLVNNLLTNYGGNVAAITYSGTVGTGATDWASENTANNAVVALGAAGSGGSYSNDDYSAATNNVNITSSTPAPVSPFTVSTLAFRTNQAYNMTLPAGTSSLSAGGILVGSQVGANNVTFSGPGAITGGTGNEVILHQYNTGTVTFGSGTIANNGATAVQFTKAGPGTTILLGTQTYTGSTNVSAGTLQLGTGLTGGNTTLSSPTVYISAGGRLVYDNADNQTITTQWTTDGYAQSGNNLDIVQKLGAGTLYLTPAAANSGRVGIEFSGGIVSVTNLSGGASDPFGSYNNTNGTQFFFDGGAVQFTGSAASSNLLYHQAQVDSNGATFMADGTGSPMVVEGNYLFPGLASRTVTLEATNGVINPGTATTGSTLTTTGGGGQFVATITDTSNNPLTGGGGGLTGSTKVIKTGPGIWQISQAQLQSSGGLLVSQGTVLLTSTSTGGIYLPNSYTYAGVTIAKNAILDVGGATTAAGQFLWLNGPLRGEGTIINSATTGSAPGGYGYGTVMMNNTNATHDGVIQPGPTTDTSAVNGAAATDYGIGTLTTGTQVWYGWAGVNRYDWDVTAVSGAGGAQPLTTNTGAQAQDFLNIQGQLDLTNCASVLNSWGSGSAGSFLIGVHGISGTALGAIANWNPHKTYTWTIATATGGFVNPGAVAGTLVTPTGFGSGQPNATTGTGFLTAGGVPNLSISGNNLILTYTGDGNVTPASFTMAASTSAARILTGNTATITGTITNTATGTPDTADTVSYTGFGVTGGGGSFSGGTLPKSNTYGLGWTASDTGTITFTGGTTGVQTITPTVTSATNSYLGTSLTPTSTTSATVDVVAMRTFAAPATLNLGNVLLNAAVPVSSVLTYTTSGDHTTTTDVTFTNAGGSIGNGLSITGGTDTFNSSATTSGSRTISGTFSSGTYGTASGGIAMTSTGEGLTGEGTYSVAFNYTANVGMATAGTPLTANVSNGAGFQGLASKTSAGGSMLGTEAILTGGHSTADVTLSETWRARTAAEQTIAGGGLISDVVSLTGINPGDVFSLQMSYSPTELTRIWGPGQTPFMAVLNGSTWTIAGTINKGIMDAPTGANLSSDLGWYGYDPVTDVVWVVTNQDASFAAVPEPGTVALLLTSMVGLGLFAWRRKRAG